MTKPYKYSEFDQTGEWEITTQKRTDLPKESGATDIYLNNGEGESVQAGFTQQELRSFIGYLQEFLED